MTTSTPRGPALATASPAALDADPAILHANLGAIARRDPALGALIAAAAPHPSLSFSRAPDGAPTAVLSGRALASQRAPLEEAARLADTIDLETTGGIVILGFGLGHHASELARRARTASALVIFEPDIPLLRAVLERVDHSEWLANTVWTFATDPDNAVALSTSLRGLEAPLAVGVAICDHPPSRHRLGESGPRFATTFARTFAAMRTHIITTMMQTDVTMRNEAMNVAHYVRRPGIDDLVGLAAGRPAIVVSAGPSLRRNVELLKTPGLRDRCVIIAVQTVLKHLLAQGIRPHFVTAIDYHEISKRFYEGLTGGDVEGVTLVGEARANAAILDAFPGDIRVPGDDFLDAVLDRTPANRARLTPGATVAHQAYYLARAMGADPVILIGQDLAFTDGQYYAPKAAIHDTWAPELNPFTSLERLEWERIARARGTLIEAVDHLGRRVYTDEQMATYLAQFERDFAADADMGLLTIDATEGGVRKDHCTPMPLRDAIDRFAHAHVAPLPTIPPAPSAIGDDEAAIRARIRAVARDARRIARESSATLDLLRKLPATLHDRAATNRTIDRINAIRDTVQSLDPAFGLVTRLNQTGALKRFKADRLIRLAESLSPQDVQKRQIDRDGVNVTWVRDMADLLADLLDEAERTFDGGPKRTHDTAPPTLDADSSTPTITTGAIILALDTAAAEREFLGRPALAHTLTRLARCTSLAGATVIATDPERIGHIVSTAHLPFPITVAQAPAPDSRRVRAIGAARAFSRASWRGGIAGMSIFDEILDPALIAPAIESTSWDGAMLLGADWCLVDPGLAADLIARFAESPVANALTFSQAPPGLAPCIASREFLTDLAKGATDHPLYATAGAALGYIPLRPRSDPIAKPSCIQIDAPIRSTLARCIPDSAVARAELESALSPHAHSIANLGAADIARILRDHRAAHTPHAPTSITLEITTARPWRTRSGIDPGASWPDAHLASDRAEALLRTIARAFPSTPITLGGRGDPMHHPDWPAIVDAARAHNLTPIHLRTTLAGDIHHEARLATCSLDAISIDVFAHQATTYERLTGKDAYAQVLTRIDALLGARTPGLPAPWIVPRITRCDAVYDEVEVFFDKWTILTGAAAIDPLPAPIPGDRIEPLPIPPIARAAHARAHLTIRADCSIPGDATDPASPAFATIDPTDPVALAHAWRTLSAARHAAITNSDWSNPILNTGC